MYQIKQCIYSIDKSIIYHTIIECIIIEIFINSWIVSLEKLMKN